MKPRLDASTASAAIGGYLELELPRRGLAGLEHMLGFQSACAAFRALLRAGRPRRVWMPWYICNRMSEALEAEGVGCERYRLDRTLAIEPQIPLCEDDWLLYVNYFGVCDRHVQDLLARYPAQQVVIDSAQAFFAEPAPCLATVYSPRKFFGLPDGGLLVTSIPASLPLQEDEGSIKRCTHLLRRLQGEPEAGYADYRNAELSLDGEAPLRMSGLTRRLLESVDRESARRLRHDNFCHLQRRLGHLNSLDLSGVDASPLCYPFLLPRPGLKDWLAQNRIYAPSYWPGLEERLPAAAEIERKMIQGCVGLPCDQRYGLHEMERICDAVRAFCEPASPYARESAYESTYDGDKAA